MLGYRIRNAYVVLQVFNVMVQVPTARWAKDLKIIGTLNKTSKISDFDQPEDFASSLLLVFHEAYDKVVAVDSAHSYTVVTFIPPNLRNLEYFSVRPILLQSTGNHPKEATLVDKMAQFQVSTAVPDRVCISDDIVLDRINQCQRIRAAFVRKRPANSVLKRLRHAAFLFLHTLVSFLVVLAVSVVRLLNMKVRGSSLAEISAWCKQLDLRMRQISFFPVQFLCYYDPSILVGPNLLDQLQLPVSNSAHNINNSNYINLYNSLWLIVNDVLFGITAHRLYVRYHDAIFAFINDRVLEQLAFSQLHVLVSWVGSDHPAGFKLNNELGQFLAGMFLWMLQVWRSFFEDVLLFTENGHTKKVLEMVFTASCYCGVSFMVAMLADYLKVVTLHVYFFNLATTKIYHRQVETLKSLMQLFRGRKYNVLRQRIDNLDKDQFHIDQLLLGTFLFTILVYLLPTTFAFYFLFFGVRVAILTCLKLGDKLLIVLNLYPLFVMLLKLKNSRRLQGGIIFESQGSCGNTNWLHMANKALTYDEILRNFVHVFRQEGRFVRLAWNFAEGHQVELRNTRAMKFHYLMLPENYDNLVAVWEGTKKEHHVTLRPKPEN